MINKLPIVGWILSLLGAIGLAVPFFFFWSYMEIGKIYFHKLPALYHYIPFWHCVGIFICISILKSVFLPKGLLSSTTNTAPQLKLDDFKPK